PRSNGPSLSKSRFTTGLQCHRLLWWTVNEPDAPELGTTPEQQAIFHGPLREGGGDLRYGARREALSRAPDDFVDRVVVQIGQIRPYLPRKRGCAGANQSLETEAAIPFEFH